jgi:hypothetical protein
MKEVRHILVHAGWSGASLAAKAATEEVADAYGVQLEIIPTESAHDSLAQFGLTETDFQGWAEAFRIENGNIVFRGALAGPKGPFLSSITKFIKNGNGA